MNNLLEYEDFVNENIFTDVKVGYTNIKNKIIKAWDKLDFQKREVILRKIYNYLQYGSFSICLLFAAQLICHYWIFFHQLKIKLQMIDTK